jgi:hypothetical protein
MKKKVFRERRMKVVVLGTEKPVISEYNPETKITVNDDGEIVEIKPKKEKKAKK